MTYFKISAGSKIITAITDMQFAKFIAKNCIDMCCSIDSVQFVITDYGFFRDSWMCPVKNRPDIKQALITQITADEYEKIKFAESYNGLPELQEQQEIEEYY